MDPINLSNSAAQLLRELVTDARHDIHSGVVSYGTAERNAEVLEDLGALDGLAREILTEVHA
jgi:hypothetical protein